MTMSKQSITEQFIQLSEDKQLDCFIEIQQFLLDKVADKLPDEVLEEVKRREQEDIEGKVEMIPYSVIRDTLG